MVHFVQSPHHDDRVDGTVRDEPKSGCVPSDATEPHPTPRTPAPGEAPGGNVHTRYLLLIRVRQISHQITAAAADIEHAPSQAQLLSDARARGLSTVDGLGMLLHQAVPGFERWFGVRPEVTPQLRAHVMATLGEE